jgi:hypothetical protein
MQFPNPVMFFIGTKSMMFAAGTPSMVTMLAGSTIRLQGAVPMVQSNFAPFTTGMAMADISCGVRVSKKYTKACCAVQDTVTRRA